MAYAIASVVFQEVVNWSSRILEDNNSGLQWNQEWLQQVISDISKQAILHRNLVHGEVIEFMKFIWSYVTDCRMRSPRQFSRTMVQGQGLWTCKLVLEDPDFSRGQQYWIQLWRTASDRMTAWSVLYLQVPKSDQNSCRYSHSESRFVKTNRMQNRIIIYTRRATPAHTVINHVWSTDDVWC